MRWVVDPKCLPFRGVLLAFACAITFHARPASACTCSAGPQSNCQVVKNAGILFEATVESVELSSPPAPRGANVPAGAAYVGGGRTIARLKDVKAYLGTPQATIVTSANAGACGFPFQPGTRYLFDAYKEPDGRLATSSCSGTRTVESATELIKFLTAFKQSSTTFVWGRALRGSEPVSGVNVTLTGPKIVTVTTSATGHFDARDLPYGAYSVSARVPASTATPRPDRTDFTLERGGSCMELAIEVPANPLLKWEHDNRNVRHFGRHVQGQALRR